MFRDPFVWKVDDGWRMAVGAGYARRAVSDPAVQRRRTCTNGPVSATSPACPDRRATDPKRVMRGNAPRFLSWPAAASPSWAPGAKLRGPNTRAVIGRSGSRPDSPRRSRDELLRRLGVEGQPVRPADVRLDNRGPGAGPMARSGMGRSAIAAAAGVVGRRQHGSVGAGADLARTTGRRRGTSRWRHRRCPMRNRCADGPPARVRLHFGEAEHLDVVLDADANSLTVDRTTASTDPGAHGGTATAKTHSTTRRSPGRANLHRRLDHRGVHQRRSGPDHTRVPGQSATVAHRGARRVHSLDAGRRRAIPGSSSATDRPAQSRTHTMRLITDSV